MPDPISSTNRSTYDDCDPSNSCCSAEPTPVDAASPNVVSIPPVLITGDAGAQALLQQYDDQGCGAEVKTAVLSCTDIATGGNGRLGLVASLFRESVECGMDLRSLYDCALDRDARAASLADAIDGCHERDGLAKPGSSQNEIICEVTR